MLPIRYEPAAAVLLATMFWALSSGRAAVDDPARLIPDSAVVYVELARPDVLIDRAVSPSTHELFEGIKGYQGYLQSPEFGQFRLGVNLLEARLGTAWQQALGDLIGGGVCLAFDPEAKAVLVVSRARNPDLLERLNRALAELIEADARNRNVPSPVKSKQHNGTEVWTFGGEEYHAILDDLLVVSNRPEGLKGAIDRYTGASAKSLADVAEYQQARAQIAPGAIGWAWAGLAAVRKVPGVEKVLNSRSDNPLAELVVGGVLETLRHAPFVAASLHLDQTRLRLAAHLPRDPAQAAASRAWYFAAEAANGAAAALQPEGTIASFTTYRDLSGLWMAREELFDEKTVAGFARADTQLGLFFSGRDFGPEVLGELSPRIRFVVARQEFAAPRPIPALKLPAMALVVEMKHPEAIATQLLLAYQKVVGLANIAGGQAGQPQLLLSAEDYHGVNISKASYLVEAGAAPQPVPVHYNFSPACASLGKHFVVGSTVGIVRELVDLVGEADAAPAAAENTMLALDAGQLAAILEDNHELLVSQNMLSEGHGRQEAEREIGTLLHLVRLLASARLGLAAEPESLVLEMALEFQPPQANP